MKAKPTAISMPPKTHLTELILRKQVDLPVNEADDMGCIGVPNNNLVITYSARFTNYKLEM